MSHYDGTCEALTDVDVAGLIDWIIPIPFEEWPQQNRLSDGRIRPAMITDLNWHEFGRMVDPFVSQIIGALPPECHGGVHNRMLSVVMPGADIELHSDAQPYWGRLHVPLTTNDRSLIYIEDQPYCLKVGTAYLMNITRPHRVVNGGETPRIHFMFDVERS